MSLMLTDADDRGGTVVVGEGAFVAVVEGVVELVVEASVEVVVDEGAVVGVVEGGGAGGGLSPFVVGGAVVGLVVDKSVVRVGTGADEVVVTPLVL